MEREIKFRGFSKRFRPNEWFYGDLVNYRSEKYILPEGQDVWDIIGDGVEVHSESVGQFTGLYDKNGVEIYEGDVLEIQEERSVVFFEEGCFFVKFKAGRYKVGVYDPAYISVIGNIHKNPELLK